MLQNLPYSVKAEVNLAIFQMMLVMNNNPLCICDMISSLYVFIYIITFPLLF